MSRWNRVCGLLAVVAVVIYMLACGSRPAWSPDSKRVVFAFVDREAQTSGLALYDLGTGEVKRIFESEEEMLYQPVWLAKKEEVISLAAREGGVLDIIQVGLDEGEFRVLKSISTKQAMTALMVPPVLVDGRYMFFSFEPDEEDSVFALHRFDLKKGKLSKVPGGAEHYLFQMGKRCFYLAGGEEAVEIGSMDTGRLKFRRLVTLDKKTYGKVGLGLAAKRNGSTFAVVVGRERKTLAIMIINRRGKIVKEITISEDLGADSTKVAHIVFGPKGKSLWVPVVRAVAVEGSAETADEKQVEYKLLLLEVEVKKGSYRTVIETRVQKDDDFLMQPSISPDGRWLAVEVLRPADEPGSLLYLVDLTSPERTVRRVAVPSSAELIAEPTGAAEGE